MLINTNNCMARQGNDPNCYIQCNNVRQIDEYCRLHHDDNVKQYNMRIDDAYDLDTINNLLDKFTIVKMDPLFDITKYPDYNLASKSFDELQTIISGPAYVNPLLAHNNMDPISQEEIWVAVDGHRQPNYFHMLIIINLFNVLT
jgi:hypothetical protein